MQLKQLAQRFNIFSNEAGGAPKKVTTSRFDNQAARDFLRTRFDSDKIRKYMVENSKTALTAKRNSDGTYDVVAAYTVNTLSFGPSGAPAPDPKTRKTTVRYGLSLQKAVQELEEFEDTGIAGIKLPNEADRPAYIRSNFTRKYKGHNVKRVKADYAAAISGSARLTAARIKAVGTNVHAMILARILPHRAPDSTTGLLWRWVS